MSGKTLVAELPRMTAADLSRFEEEGGIWGQQRKVRKQQVAMAGYTSLATSAVGTLWAKTMRGNTNLVAVGTLPLFAVCGAIIGHGAGITLYPSVASNKETTLMRRMWWAKECAKGWSFDQVNEGQWRANYPNTKIPGAA